MTDDQEPTEQVSTTPPMAAFPPHAPEVDTAMAAMRFEVAHAHRVPDHVLRDLAAAVLTVAYRGAAADGGDVLVEASPAEWLRRLLDLSESDRLETVRLVQKLSGIAAHCLEKKHDLND